MKKKKKKKIKIEMMIRHQKETQYKIRKTKMEKKNIYVNIFYSKYINNIYLYFAYFLIWKTCMELNPNRQVANVLMMFQNHCSL